MAVVVVCLLLLLAGLVAIVRWGGLSFQPAPGAGGDATPPPAGLVVRWYVWYLAMTVMAGVGAGLLVAGAGGRLVMRLLAATSSEAAQGQITEAEEVVGRITVDGTIGFVVFTGLFFGLASGALYLLLRHWLPSGRLGGLAYGGLLWILAATRIDPLRADNPDFDIVGPDWVSVLSFSVLVLLHGMLVAALAARLSRSVPLIAADRRAVAWHAPLAVLLLGPAVVVVLAAVGALLVLVTRAPVVVRTWRGDPTRTVVGRVLVLAAVALALPGFFSALVDIATAS